MRITILRVVGCAGSAALLAGCSLGGDEPAGSGAGSSTGAKPAVTLMTHDSFEVPKSLLTSFTKDTGYPVKVVRSGDAGQVTNKVVLTKDSPVADAVFGIDTTFASRAVDAGALTPSGARLPEGADRFALTGKAASLLAPVDEASTCVNIDKTWFARHGITPPKTLNDLTKPAYKNLFVAPGAPTSSPGLSLLVASVGEFGQSGWQDWWRKLVANGAKITDGWTQAYNVDFTAGEGKGSRPIVWSYDTSPAFTVSGGRSSTAALLDTCTRSVEYAGVLKGAKNTAGAKALVQWMLQRDFQKTLPTSMYVFPVDSGVTLPSEWRRFAKRPSDPISVSPTTVAAKRQTWLSQWQDVAAR